MGASRLVAGGGDAANATADGAAKSKTDIRRRFEKERNRERPEDE
jgi:hypothetical protein